jgi:hypothetical protein
MDKKTLHLTPPKFTLFDVRYATDDSIIARGEALYKKGKVRLGVCDEKGYSAIVEGTQPYTVWLSARALDHGDCDCYMGQQAQYCKHLLALAFLVLHETGTTNQQNQPLTETEAKLQIATGAKKFTAYTGPSRVWFAYQQRLAVGAGMIHGALPFLPNDQKTIGYLWKLILRVSRKLSHGGVDDSDGTVGSCIDAIIERVVDITKTDKKFLRYAREHCVEDTGFGFEEELQKRLLQYT